jgi:hypothetical protein
VEGVVSNHDPYSDYAQRRTLRLQLGTSPADKSWFVRKSVKPWGQNQLGDYAVSQDLSPLVVVVSIDGRELKKSVSQS